MQAGKGILTMDNDKLKVLIRFGLMGMDPETREEKLNEVIQGNRVSGLALAKLIDECLDICYKLTEREGMDESQKIQIRWMLERIDGKEAVYNMDPEEIVELVLDLKEGRFTGEELKTIVKSIMKRK